MDLLICLNLMINMFPNTSHFQKALSYFITTLLSLESYFLTSSFFFLCPDCKSVVRQAQPKSMIRLPTKLYATFIITYSIGNTLLSKIPVVPSFHFSFSVTDHQEENYLHSAFTCSLLSLILLCPFTFSGAFITSTIIHFI